MKNRILAALTVVLAAVLPLQAADPEVKLEKTDIAGLEKAIATHKGKVVLVDVWADFCIPCKKKFPHVVQMHKDLAKDGLVVISLSIDELASFESALRYLKMQSATFTNYILDDTDENREKKLKDLNTNTPPIMHVFDRSGKKRKSLSKEADLTDEAVEKLVKELLKEKE